RFGGSAASGPPRTNATRSCGRSPISGRWPISKGLWRTTLEPSTHPHLCTSRLLLLAEFGDGVLQRWGFFIPAILRKMFPAVWVCGQNPGPKRRMSVYSREERMKAVKLYFQYDRQVAPVLRELGYPSRGALRWWVAEFEATGDVHAGYRRERHPSKYSEAQKRAAVDCYLTHGRNLQKTVRALGLSLSRFGGHKRLVSERCPSRRFKHAANASTIPT